MPGAPTITIAGPATPEEAAAVMAAVRRFRDDHAPVIEDPAPTVTPWQRAALLEGVDRDPQR